MLSTKNNLTALMNLSGRWIDTVRNRKPLKELILDLDSSVSETYGQQQGTGECTAFGRETTHEPTLRMGHQALGSPVKPTSRLENQRATGISHSSRLIWRSYRSECIRAVSKWEIRGKQGIPPT